MAALPAGLEFVDLVVVERAATPGVAYHRPSDGQAVCGADLVVPQQALVALAVGLGCEPCAVCWPPPAGPAGRSGPRLRPAVPWPDNRAGYRSRLRRDDTAAARPRPAVPDITVPAA